MTEVTDRKTAVDSAGSSEEADEEAVDAVGTYETGDGTVFYDTENPLAWVQSGVTVRLTEMA